MLGALLADAAVADVLAQHVGGLVAADALDVMLLGAGQGGSGDEASAQGVAAELARVEAGGGDDALDDQRHALRAQAAVGWLAGGVHAGEERPVGQAVGAQGSQPVLQGAHGAQRGVGLGVDHLAFALGGGIAFRAAQAQDSQPLAQRQVGDVEADEFGAAEGAGEAEQQQGAVAPAGGGVGQEGEGAGEVGGEQGAFAEARGAPESREADQGVADGGGVDRVGGGRVGAGVDVAQGGQLDAHGAGAVAAGAVEPGDIGQQGGFVGGQRLAAGGGAEGGELAPGVGVGAAGVGAEGGVEVVAPGRARAVREVGFHAAILLAIIIISTTERGEEAPPPLRYNSPYGSPHGRS